MRYNSWLLLMGTLHLVSFLHSSFARQACVWQTSTVTPKYSGGTSARCIASFTANKERKAKSRVQHTTQISRVHATRCCFVCPQPRRTFQLLRRRRPSPFFDSNFQQIPIPPKVGTTFTTRFLSASSPSTPSEASGMTNDIQDSSNVSNSIPDHLTSMRSLLPNDSLQKIETQDLSDEIVQLTKTWRDNARFNPILRFPCWRVHSNHSKALQLVMESPLTKQFLATRMDIWDMLWQGHRKIRLVQPDPESNGDYKLILLHPKVVSPSSDKQQKLPDEAMDFLKSNCVEDGISPITGDRIWVTKQLRPSDFAVSYILEYLLPQHLHPPPSSFETIGHVAHLNLKEHHLPYRFLIGEVLLEVVPNLRTVIHKIGEVSGPFRTYPYEIVAERKQENDKDNRRSSTVVSMLEWGVDLSFDVRDVYWSSRLSYERRRLVKNGFQKGQWIADAFCGVGALCLQAALHKECIITANDWNPSAIQALKQNVKTNKVDHCFHEITCGDAYEFLASLGFSNQQQQIQQRQRKYLSSKKKKGEGRASPIEQQPSLPSNLPHHVILNYPLDAASFLGALRWWKPPHSGRFGGRKKNNPKIDDDVVPRVHVYIFAKEPSTTNNESTTITSTSFSPNGKTKNEVMEHIVVDEIASNLLPILPGQDNVVEEQAPRMTRWEELDENFGCNIHVHNVRDVAPGKTVYCVSFSATSRLLRYMQGDYQ